MIRAALIKNFNPISNGVDYRNQSSILEMSLIRSTTVTCQATYGFLPCTTELWGQLFLIVVYEYLLSLGQKYISDGSNLFFKIFGTGIFGASLFHILGTIPQVVIMLVTGISGSNATAVGMVSMGMGNVAGAAIMSLTLIWGSCVAFGSYDLSKTETSSKLENTKKFSSSFGVTTDIETSYTAGIMFLSMIPFLILQLPKIFHSSVITRVAILISLLITLAFLFSYCIYQVFQPWIQNRRLEYLMRKYVKDYLLQSLLTPIGDPDITVIRQLFHEIDQNNDSHITYNEVRSLILGIQLEEVGLSKDKYVAKVMEEFDSSGDARIDEKEFVRGISKWLSEANDSADDQEDDKPQIFSTARNGTGEEKQKLLTKKKQSHGSRVENSLLNYSKAAFLLVLGTAICLLLAQPLMDAIQGFATAVNIPSFLVSYFVVPLATNYKLALSAITSARKKKQKAASLTFSEIYGSVFMNTMMSLAVFLLIVSIRDLSWDASAQVLVILIVGVVIGLFTSFRTNYPFWTCIVAFLLYPISLLLIYVLPTVLKWS